MAAAPDLTPPSNPAPAAPTPIVIAPPAGRARIQTRHRMLLRSFLVMVAAPVLLLSLYLLLFAQSQYASEAGFSVRKEDSGSADMFGGLSQFAGAVSADAEILYDYIRSPDLVTQIDKDFGLYEVYGRHHLRDPIFSIGPDASIEEKESYWQRMVRVEFNEATGLIRLEVKAFTPEEAQKIAKAVIEYSSQMINRLSDAARDDATRYARAERDKAVEQLKVARAALTAFRSRTQVIDPLADVQGQMGLMKDLESQLAETLISLDELRATVGPEDVRIAQLELRVEIIEKRLAAERKKFGLGADGTPDDESYAEKVAQYEMLVVEREVAEERFRATTILLNAAEAEANRKSRYLAAHVEPTLAQQPLYPRSMTLVILTSLILMLIWTLAALIYYSIRDRR